jgi:predicted RNase H-like HicB family nuclease
MMKTLEEYLALPYTVEVTKNEDGFFARVEELPGCMTWSARIDDVWPMVEDAMRAWIDDALEAGDAVPEPQATGEASRGTPLRLPTGLQRKLLRRASQEGMSADPFVTTTLANAVGE